MEIKTQSLFSPSSSNERGRDRERAKKTRALLIEACSKTRGGAFRKPTASESSGTSRSLETVRTREMRNSLGIKTLRK